VSPKTIISRVPREGGKLGGCSGKDQNDAP
jgi:hypothetical protein